MSKSYRSVAALAACAFALLLSACGGGGGGGSTANSDITILDSFGNVVYQGSSSGSGKSIDGFGAGDQGADGSAGDGAPIVGGAVLITDISGKTATAVTNGAGYYRAKVTNMKPPFVVTVTKSDGVTVRHSLNVTPLAVNGFVTINITGLTDKIASDVALAGGQTGAAQLTPQIVAANGAAIAQSIDSLRTALAPVISAAGITSANFDPLKTPFKTDHTGYDYVLDNTLIAVDVSGATTVVVSPTFVPPTTGASTLAGTWTLTSSDNSGQTTPTTSPVTAAQVPTSLAQYNTFLTNPINLPTQTNLGITSTWTGTQGDYTLTSVGSSINLTYHYVVTASNYVGCGACGVGSSVTVIETTAYTIFDNLAGSAIPGSSLTMTMVFNRTN